MKIESLCSKKLQEWGEKDNDSDEIEDAVKQELINKIMNSQVSTE